MTDIKEMLNDEIERSGEFSKRSFGLKYGDEFPEIARAAAESKAGIHMFIGLVMGAVAGKSVAEEVGSLPEGVKPDEAMGQIILRNQPVFDTPLSMFYYGIQIGRRMEREETKALAGIEKLG